MHGSTRRGRLSKSSELATSVCILCSFGAHSQNNSNYSTLLLQKFIPLSGHHFFSSIFGNLYRHPIYDSQDYKINYQFRNIHQLQVNKFLNRKKIILKNLEVGLKSKILKYFGLWIKFSTTLSAYHAAIFRSWCRTKICKYYVYLYFAEIEIFRIWENWRKSRQAIEFHLFFILLNIL